MEEINDYNRCTFQLRWRRLGFRFEQLTDGVIDIFKAIPEMLNHPTRQSQSFQAICNIFADGTAGNKVKAVAREDLRYAPLFCLVSITCLFTMSRNLKISKVRAK